MCRIKKLLCVLAQNYNQLGLVKAFGSAVAPKAASQTDVNAKKLVFCALQNAISNHLVVTSNEH